jgi:hypothetical protein
MHGSSQHKFTESGQCKQIVDSSKLKLATTKYAIREFATGEDTQMLELPQQHLHFNDQFKCQFQRNYPAERPTSLHPDYVPGSRVTLFIFIKKVFLISQGVLPPTLNTPSPFGYLCCELSSKLFATF